MNREVDVDPAVSEYRKFLPPLPLVRHLLCLWTSVIVGSGGNRRTHHCWCPTAASILFLPMTRFRLSSDHGRSPSSLATPSGTVIVGARFHPGLGPGLLGLPRGKWLCGSIDDQLKGFEKIVHRCHTNAKSETYTCEVEVTLNCQFLGYVFRR